ncbi:MAG: stage III sporulation protein AF [Clostridiales bacterium]|jgi:stage III sporulation protein AF|nr:stage III sporulation protein AF [Clostridiales bacterium]
MLEVITEIVRNVAILTLLTLFLELLLPDSQLSRFVQMFMGLLLLAAVLNPVLGLLNLGELLNPVMAAADSSQTAALIQEGQDLASDLQQSAGREYL